MVKQEIEQLVIGTFQVRASIVMKSGWRPLTGYVLYWLIRVETNSDLSRWFAGKKKEKGKKDDTFILKFEMACWLPHIYTLLSCENLVRFHYPLLSISLPDSCQPILTHNLLPAPYLPV